MDYASLHIHVICVQPHYSHKLSLVPQVGRSGLTFEGIGLAVRCLLSTSAALRFTYISYHWVLIHLIYS